jgi:hypothetical protein
MPGKASEKPVANENTYAEKGKSKYITVTLLVMRGSSPSVPNVAMAPLQK